MARSRDERWKDAGHGASGVVLAFFSGVFYSQGSPRIACLALVVAAGLGVWAYFSGDEWRALGRRAVQRFAFREDV